MKVPDIGEEERTEIFIALRERKENLEKLEKKTDEMSVPIDVIEERLALYRDRERIAGGERQVVPGLLAIFAAEPELSTEALENQQRKVDGAPDLFGGGAETGGGHKPGRKGKWKSKNDKGEGGAATDPNEIAVVDSVITPPAPRAPLELPAVGSPSNSDVVDVSPPKRPSSDGIQELRAAVEAGLEEPNPARDRLATTAAGAQPSGRQIVDARADARDTKMDGAADG